MEAEDAQLIEQTVLRRQRILIVGAGATGQVFAYHLQAAGADIAWFVKPEYAEDAREGFDIHRYGLSGLRPKRRVNPVDVYTDPRELRARTFDQIWLCVSSPALRSDLIPQIHSSCPDALWVSFQPGIGDRDFLAWRLQKTKILTGMVNFIAYQAPLDGEDLWPEGIAYFVPPMSMTPFTGPEPYVSAVANLLQSGGLTAGVRPDTVELARFGSATLIPIVIALEAMGWSWDDLRASDPVLALVASAITDIQTAVEKASGRTSGAFSLAQKKWALKMALFAAPRLATFPLQAYFRYHFSKIRGQSDQMVDELAQFCRDNALLPRALESLAQQWRSRRPPMDSDSAEPVAAPDLALPAPPVGTGAFKPVALPAPIVVDDDEEIDELALLDLPTPLPGEVLVDDQSTPPPVLVAAKSVEPKGLEEPTGDVDPAVVADDVRPEPPVEEQSEPPVTKAPILRSLADLDSAPEVVESESDTAERSAPAVSVLPFDVPDELDEESEEFDELSEASEAEDVAALPSIMIADEAYSEEQPRETQKTIRDPSTVPAEVHFKDDTPEEKKGGLSREDFVQTELAIDSQSASLRDLKLKLRSRLGAKQTMSPALESDTSDEK